MSHFESTLESFVDEVNEMIEEEWDYTYADAPVVSIDTGGRSYVRLVKGGKGHQNGMYCFVRKAENAAKGSRVGDILKAASWKSPADHARGNIFDDNRMNAVTTYGAVYMR